MVRLIGFIVALGFAVSAALADQTLRIVTWNIETVGAPGEPQYAAALSVLNRLDADLVALQEVNGRDDVDAAEDLAFDLGYLYVAISPQGAYDGLRTALFSDYPILASDAWTSVELSGDALANDLTRDPFEVTVDLPGDAPDLRLILTHLKSGSGNDDEFRRAIESYRLTQITDTFHADAPFIILGDLNADRGDDPLTPTLFIERPNGLPLSFETGADIDLMLATTGLLNDPFAWLGTVAHVLPALQLDGTDATRPASGRSLDYLLLSPQIDPGLAQAQIYDCADEGLSGGLLLVGPPLATETCENAADHLPVFADLVVGATFNGDECSTSTLTLANRTLNSGRHQYRSEQGISVGDAVQVGTGAELLLSAPSIRLMSGFGVAAGGTLRVSATAVNCAQATGSGTLSLPARLPGTRSTEPSATQPPQLILTATSLPDGVHAQLNTLGIDLNAITSALLAANGQWLILETTEALQTNDDNGVSDLYRVDRRSHQIQLISATESAQAGNGASRNPTADATGERIVFESEAENLVSGDANGVSDLFLRDLALGTTERLTEGEYASAHPGIDAAGTEIVYDQQAASGDRSVHTATLGDAQSHRILTSDDDPSGVTRDHHHPAISGDGRFVVSLQERVTRQAGVCQIHLYDHSTEVYHLQSCPAALAEASDQARAAFSPEGDVLFWSLPGQAAPLTLSNPLY